MAAAASFLGLTEVELREQLADQTLAEIAKAKDKSVSGLVQAMVTAAENGIDEAVADGRLTQEHATELKAELQDRIESLVNGDFRDHEFGFHPSLMVHRPRVTRSMIMRTFYPSLRFTPGWPTA